MSGVRRARARDRDPHPGGMAFGFHRAGITPVPSAGATGQAQINADYEKELAAKSRKNNGLATDPHRLTPVRSSGPTGQALTGNSHAKRKIKERKDQKAEFNIPVFIDSPLGLEITKIYSSLSEYWDKEAKALMANGDHPVDFEGLYAVERFRDHKRLLEMDGPAVVIAGSGMCTGGRIIEHMKAGIEDSRNDIFFVGYQAKGTAGRDILKYSKRPGGYVVLDGERFDIKAKVHQLTGYSAHADQNGLIEWVGAMTEKPGRIKLVHGEAGAQRALYRELGKE